MRQPTKMEKFFAYGFMRKGLPLITPLGIAFLLSGCLFNPYPIIEKMVEKDKQDDMSWVPVGFNANGTGGAVAYKFIPTEKTSCRLNLPCTQVEVASKDGCNTLYAQAPLLNGNNVNVGYTNDVTHNIPANGRAILTFTNTNRDAVNMQIPEFKCY